MIFSIKNFLVVLILFIPLSVHTQADITSGEATDLILMHYRSQLASTTDFNSSTDYFIENNVTDITNLPPDEFYRAKITNIANEEVIELFGGYTEQTQEVEVIILNGPDKGNTELLIYGGLMGEEKYQNLKKGDKVVVVKNYSEDGLSSYFITEHFRINSLLLVFCFFVLLALFFGRKKGAGAILGLAFSIFILSGFIVPKIIAGSDPLLITLSGTFVIAAVSLFLAHGFNRRTTIAFFSTIITLSLAWGLSEVFVRITHLFGEGTESAFYLQMGGLMNINLRGLLLAGIVIGTLGVLDDITTAQTAVVGELRQANPSFSSKDLYNRSLIVGREHIASLVNTLVLAYAGSSLPLFILFALNKTTPWWVTLNSEMIAEEIIRTIIGSSALILAVPITSLLATYYLKKEKIRPDLKAVNYHNH